MPRANAWAGTVAAGLMASVAHGAVVEYELNGSVGRTDNVARSGDLAEAATLKAVGTRLSILQETRKTEANVEADLQILDYGIDAIGNDLSGAVSGRTSIALIEERLRWSAEDSFGQSRQDLFAAPTPQNLENVNYFSTGPDLLVGLGRSTSLQLGARYSRVDFERSAGDSDRISGWAAIRRQLSRSGTVELTFTGEAVSPEERELVPSHERYEAFLRYGLTGSRTEVVIDVGANQVGWRGTHENGALLRFEVARDFGRFSRMSLSAGQESTDAGGSLQSSIGVPSPASRGAFQLQSAGPFTSSYASLAWDIAGRFTTIGVSAEWFREDYVEVSASDVKRETLALTGSRRLGARSEIALGARYNRYRFESDEADNDDLVLNASLSRQFGRRVRLQLSAEKSKYSTDAPSAGFDETRYWFRLAFGGTIGR